MRTFSEEQKVVIVNKSYRFGQVIPSPFVKDIESKISNLHKQCKEDNKPYWEAFQKGFSLAIQERKILRQKKLAQIQDKPIDRSRNR